MFCALACRGAAQEAPECQSDKPPDLSKPQKSYDFCTVETYIDGEYIKLNDNNGWVNYDVPFELMNEAAAFSHFTYEHFEGKPIIVDSRFGA